MTDSEDPHCNQDIGQPDPADLLLLKPDSTPRAISEREMPFQMRIKGRKAP
jgi:hypothetical protein